MAQIPPAFSPPDWCGTPPRGDAEDAQPALTLEITKEGSVVDKLALDKKRCYTLGRAPTCDVLVDHPSVSRQHAAILHRASDGCVLLMDLRSAHGTKMGGTPLAPQQAEVLLASAQARSTPFLLGASTRAYHVVRARDGATPGSAAGSPGAVPPPLVEASGPRLGASLVADANPSKDRLREAGGPAAGDAAPAPELAVERKADDISPSAAAPSTAVRKNTALAPAAGAAPAVARHPAADATPAPSSAGMGAAADAGAAAAATVAPTVAPAGGGGEEAGAPVSRKRRDRGKSRWSDQPPAEATATTAPSATATVPGGDLHGPVSATAAGAVHAGVLQAAALAAAAAAHRDAAGHVLGRTAGHAAGQALAGGGAAPLGTAGSLQAAAAGHAAAAVQSASAIAQLAMQRAAQINASVGGAGDKKSLEEKKKLLWAGKKVAAETAPKPENVYGHNRWDTAEFSDPSKREKFQKLMGMKSAPGGSAPPAGANPPAANGIMTEHAQHDLSHHLEHQFESGLRRRGGNTLGLGL